MKIIGYIILSKFSLSVKYTTVVECISLTLRIYKINKEAEMNHLIACQPTSLRAIRLQTLVPPRTKATQFDDILDKLEVKLFDNLYFIIQIFLYQYNT